jgi:hypothetical protein
MMNQEYIVDTISLNPGAFSNELDHILNDRGGGGWDMDMDMDMDTDRSDIVSYGSSRKNKQRNTTSNRSWELCDAEEWTALQMRLAVFPEEARTMKPATAFRGSRSMLHEACCSSTVSPLTVKTIYFACPPALLLRDTLEGRTPLHCALANGVASPPSLDMVCTILDLGQAGDEEEEDIEQRVAQIQDNLGDTALHVACRVGASKRIIFELLDACPVALLKLDNEGVTPLRRLWTRLQFSVGQVKIDKIQSWTDLVQKPEVKDTWDKVIVFLELLDTRHDPLCEPLEDEDEEEEKYVCSGESPELDFQILHVIAANDCPSGVMSLALKLYPEEFLQLNEEGQSVLDTAIAQSRSPPSNTLFDGDESLCVIDILLRHDKSATKAQDEGGIGLLYNMCTANCCHSRQPLFRAILAGKGWSHGVGALLEAEADIATQLDEGTPGLYPFMMAATITNDASGAPVPPEMSIGTSFELLRQTPELIMTSSLLLGRGKERTDKNSSKPRHKRRWSDVEKNERVASGGLKKSAS